jgi:hypothetical protein
MRQVRPVIALIGPSVDIPGGQCVAAGHIQRALNEAILPEYLGQRLNIS